MSHTASALFAASMIAIGMAGFVQPAAARNTVYHLSIQDVLDSEDFRTHVGSDVQFIFGNHAVPANAKLMGSFVSNRKTNSVGKSDGRACAWAMLSALVSLHDRALQEGGNAVVKVVSYYNRIPFVSDTEYECHAGGVIAGVALQGTVARIGR